MDDIDEIKIIYFEEQIINKFKEFERLFKEQYGGVVFDAENYKHLDSIWTCYINGRAKNYEIKGWDGIFKTWIKNYTSESEEIVPESWYRIDYAVINNSDGNWWGGKYQISFIFEQENNYGEIKGHMRQLYDFNVPQKMLLIWAMNYNHDKKKDYMEVIDYCRSKGIKNTGKIILIIGNWPLLEKLYRGSTKIENKKDIFHHEIIPAD